MLTTTSTMTMNMNMKMNLNKRSIDRISIGCSKETEGQSLDNSKNKTRKLNVSLPNNFSSSFTPTTSSSSVPPTIRFMTLPRRCASPESMIPVLSPCTYLTISLKNKKIKPRIDSFSLEQAMYFEPYQESEIKIELLKALRSSNLDELRSFQVGNKNQEVGGDKDEHQYDKGNDEDTTDDDNKSCLTEENPSFQLQARNQFGENLLHLACRMGISRDVLDFLLEDAKVPLNVRDRFGRTPLHNSCMSALPNFDNIDFVIMHAPRMLLFEDDNGKIPFELIPQRCFERWTRFLSEKNILQQVTAELVKHDGLLLKG
mmetsp:Transcript_58474/g.65412  ORF Transcript_58474/g.65412 Transcript_58474/m.65412 type:complete len:315 (-) Transcript_58474:380-1324(-)